MLLLSSADFFFKINFLKKFFQEDYQSAKGFESVGPGPEVMKLFSCSTQLSTNFILLINVKMPTIVGILTFISMINTSSDRLDPLRRQEKMHLKNDVC